MPEIDITISIVTYNSKHVIENCLRSIIETAGELSIEIIIVDNCSQDGCADFIKSQFKNINLIENKVNVGFGKAHNQSFKISNGRYFLILNPDTIIFPGVLKGIVDFMDKHPDAGTSGPKILWDDSLMFSFPDLKIHSIFTAIFNFTPFCRYFPNSILSKYFWRSSLRLWHASKPIEVKGITGGFMMFRREAFPLFDENYFLFFEEHDLLRRTRKAGWKVYFIPDIKIIHFFQESCRNSKIDIRSIYMQSAEYYYNKYYGKFGLYLLKFLRKLNIYLQNNFHSPITYEIISSGGSNEFLLRWNNIKNAAKYLVEISYDSSFVDRGGTFTENNFIILPTSILKRLPDKTGFLRIRPFYSDDSVGKVIKVFQIKD